MSEMSERIAALSPEQRRLLARRLDPAEDIPVEDIPAEVRWKLSSAQERLWFLDRLIATPSAYHVRSAVRIRGHLVPRRLIDALESLVRRHAALRTSFELVDGVVTQVVHPAVRLDVPVVDVPDHGTALSRAAALAARPMPLDRPPLLTTAVFRIDPTDHVLALVLHHIVADGWSVNVLYAEVGALYTGAELPASRTTYRDFIDWQRRTERAAGATAVAQWTRELAGAPARLTLPTDRERPRLQTFVGALHPFRLAGDDLEALRTLARSYGVSLFMVVLAGYALVLGAHADQDDVVIGTPVANRPKPEFEQVVGLFANMVALRVGTGGGSSFADLLERVRRVCLDGFARQAVPLEQIVEALRVPRDLRYQPLFQAALVMQSAGQRRITLPGLTFERLDVASGTSKFDVVLDLADAESLSGSWEYNSDLFDAATIEGFDADLRAVLRAAAAAPDTSCSRLRSIVIHDRQSRRYIERGGSMITGPGKRPGIGGARRTISVSDRLIDAEPLDVDRPAPLVVTPRVRGVNLAEWVADHRGWFEEKLTSHGAIVFRGFGVGVDGFENFMRAAGDGELLSDPARYDLHGPKEQVYITTQYPAEHEIFMHNETWWQYHWPKKIFFCAQTVPDVGGATTFADTRRVLVRMDQRIVDRFRDGVLHVRNSGTRVGMRPWQHVFGTDDRGVVEEFCRGNEIEWEWQADDCLTTRHWRPAFLRHPVSGEDLWFNHTAHSHISTNVTPAMAAAVKGLDPGEVPTNVLYADGKPIEDEVMDAIRANYRAEVVTYPWEPGNVLVLDNMLCAHGREAYQGERKVLVGMTEMTGWPGHE